MDQLRSELLRLQNQNAALMRSERELQTQLGMQEVLEEEVLRLQEVRTNPPGLRKGLCGVNCGSIYRGFKQDEKSEGQVLRL
jgi:hypothetical protein